MQQFLKPTAGFARARIVAAQLLAEFLVSVHKAISAFDASFGRESLATFTRDLETRTDRGVWLWLSWHTSDKLIPVIAGRASYNQGG
jgi:hypothetical protein